MGISRRSYAAQRGVSETAVRKAIATGRITTQPDGTIDPARADAEWTAQTDPSKQRGASANAPPQAPKLKPVPDTALSVVGDTFREQGLAPPVTGGGTTFLQAKTANEVLKAQERKLKLAKLKGELIDRDRAMRLVFQLARQERDAWVTWPPRVAALMAAEVAVEVEKQSGKPVIIEAAILQRVLEAHVRVHLGALADLRVNLG